MENPTMQSAPVVLNSIQGYSAPPAALYNPNSSDGVQASTQQAAVHPGLPSTASLQSAAAARMGIYPPAAPGTAVPGYENQPPTEPARPPEVSQQQQATPQAPVGFPNTALSTEYVVPQGQLELNAGMQARAGYPYDAAYYGGLVYGQQAMQVMGQIPQTRVALPSELIEEEPVYVNAKQYNGILRRRQQRAKAEMENRLIKSRKPYLHESRHNHAQRRQRGAGGRFLTKAEQAAAQKELEPPAAAPATADVKKGTSTPADAEDPNAAKL